MEHTKTEWINTDEYQWVKKLSSTEFKIVGCLFYDDYNCLTIQTIDLDDYSESEIEDYIKPYHKGGLKELKTLYNNENINRVIAEFISETEINVYQTFYNKDDLIKAIDDIVL